MTVWFVVSHVVDLLAGAALGLWLVGWTTRRKMRKFGMHLARELSALAPPKVPAAPPAPARGLPMRITAQPIVSGDGQAMVQLTGGDLSFTILESEVEEFLALVIRNMQRAIAHRQGRVS